MRKQDLSRTLESPTVAFGTQFSCSLVPHLRSGPHGRSQERCRSRPVSAPRAFTLLELLIVIAVIAILSGILLPAAMQAWSRAYVEKAKAAISALEVAVSMYKTDMGYYPGDGGGTNSSRLVTALTDTSQGGNWHGPYMSFKTDDIDGSGNFKDPWGNSYIYKKPGTNNTNSYDLSSLGANGVSGGTGNDADITNW